MVRRPIKDLVQYFDRLAETVVASDVRRAVSALLQEILEGVTIQTNRAEHL